MSLSAFSTSYAQTLLVSTNKVHWAQEKMQRWYDLGVIRGDENGDLMYDAYISRAEVVTIVNKVFGFQSKASQQFSDVEENSWYADELLKARQAGYLKGYEGNIAKPESKITREDTSVIILQAFELDTSDSDSSLNSFKDAKDVSQYAVAAVGKLAADGVIRGYEDGSFKPKANITRAEFISILDSLVTLLCNTPGTYENKNISGHVVISNPSVELKNSTINGNLHITEGIGNAGVTLNSVVVTDTTYISGGNDIKIIDSELNQLVVNSEDSINSLSISGKSNITKLVLNSPVNISVDEKRM